MDGKKQQQAEKRRTRRRRKRQREREREREEVEEKRGEKKEKRNEGKKSSPGALSGASGYIIVLRRTVGHRVTRKNTWTVDAQLFVWP